MGLVIPNPISLRGLKSPIAYHSLTSGDIPWSWNSKGLEGSATVSTVVMELFGVWHHRCWNPISSQWKPTKSPQMPRKQTPNKKDPAWKFALQSTSTIIINGKHEDLYRCFFVRVYFLHGSFSGNFKAWKVSPPFEKTDESLLLDG